MYLGTHSLGHAYKEKWKRVFSRASIPARNERALFKGNPSGNDKVYLHLMMHPMLHAAFWINAPEKESVSS